MEYLLLRRLCGVDFLLLPVHQRPVGRPLPRVYGPLEDGEHEAVGLDVPVDDDHDHDGDDEEEDEDDDHGKVALPDTLLELVLEIRWFIYQHLKLAVHMLQTKIPKLSCMASILQ